MKINAKDVISAGILILLAVVGLWLNMDHTLGSARRMGPGYMPMLAFWLLLGLGAIVLFLGLFNGPDPIEKWTKLDVYAVGFSVAAFFIVYGLAEASGLFTGNYYVLGFGLLAAMLALAVSPGWRPIALVHAGMAVFALMLEQFGLMVSLAATIAIASLAEREHTVRGVIGMILFLCALCYWVFIWELDIRVPVWPVFLAQY